MSWSASRLRGVRHTQWADPSPKFVQRMNRSVSPSVWQLPFWMTSDSLQCTVLQIFLPSSRSIQLCCLSEERRTTRLTHDPKAPCCYIDLHSTWIRSVKTSTIQWSEFLKGNCKPFIVLGCCPAASDFPCTVEQMAWKISHWGTMFWCVFFAVAASSLMKIRL